MVSEPMPNWLVKRADLSPERVALMTDDVTWTFSELHKFSVSAANKLSGLGVKQGDHVAVLIGNRKEFLFLLHGLEYIGAVAVLLNTKLTSHEISWQLENSESKLLVFDDVFLEKLENAPKAVKQLSLAEFINAEEGKATIRFEYDLNVVHTIIYTSGTTGNPKGVMLSYGNHWWNAVGSALNLGLHIDDCWLCATPLFHVSGLSILLRSVFYGIPVFLVEKFDPKKVNMAIENYNISFISLVSQMLVRMVAELGDKTYPKSFRGVLLGGGPAPKPLLEVCKEKEIPIYQTYGMTETASQIVTLSDEYMLSKLGSAGKPLFPAQLRIVKDDHQQAANSAGEIVVKGPNVTKGYWKNEEATEKSIINGWLYTGDIGYIDEDGFLYVLDRRNDLIISGGENIYPAEIEAVILSHSTIEEAGVVGKSDDTWGQVPVAFVKTWDGETVSKEEILDLCKERLAKYKVPVDVIFVNDGLPRNASNKLMRKELRKLLD
ncbi:2-succinylbenzoyl-CoA synthetase [Schinkia azotoformans MEV2011]|uniref:2-succinylbenzoate--CoA ligase n=2 Tax=Schinkia azotoformans TaxID=1454 RepID=A0A072NJB1_SCHAZ|nr:2-succinylbenzoyl-CoA synthetase [Schinkia azotoformans MEV2011]